MFSIEFSKFYFQVFVFRLNCELLKHFYPWVFYTFSNYIFSSTLIFDIYRVDNTEVIKFQVDFTEIQTQVSAEHVTTLVPVSPGSKEVDKLREIERENPYRIYG